MIKSHRMNMIAALNKGKIKALMTFEGHCNTDVFNGWFKQFLAPILKLGQTVISSFHQSKKIVEFAKEVGFLHILPIFAHHWFAIKTRARKNIPIFTSFRQVVDSTFL